MIAAGTIGLRHRAAGSPDAQSARWEAGSAQNSLSPSDDGEQPRRITRPKPGCGRMGARNWPEPGSTLRRGNLAEARALPEARHPAEAGELPGASPVTRTGATIRAVSHRQERARDGYWRRP